MGHFLNATSMDCYDMVCYDMDINFLDGSISYLLFVAPKVFAQMRQILFAYNAYISYIDILQMKLLKTVYFAQRQCN